MQLLQGLLAMIAWARLATAVPDRACPKWMHQSGMTNDIAFLSEVVSWGPGEYDGVCGHYVIAHEANGKYQTRMRIFRHTTTGDHYIIFRPTQQTPEGGSIHADRKLAHCTFFTGCQGKVHDRFQQGFLSLINTVDDWTPYLEAKVFTAGHSLGGSLQLFMALYLYNEYGVVPNLSLGLAGPFIGDQEFTEAHQYPFRDAADGGWWQVETQNQGNRGDVDGTVEGYQVDPNQLFIERDVICAFPIQPLPIPSQSYGMHDLNQYRLFTSGHDCSF